VKAFAENENHRSKMTNGENQLHIAFSPCRTAQRASITHQERAGFPPFLTIYEQKINWTNNLRTAQRATITHRERAGSPPFLTIYEQKINWTNNLRTAQQAPITHRKRAGSACVGILGGYKAP